MSSYNLSSPITSAASGTSRDGLQRDLRAEQSSKGPRVRSILLAECACAFAGGSLAWLLTPWLHTLGPIVDRQFGSAPEVFRDMSRASGIAAYGLLWLSMAFGLLISGRMSRVWPGGPETFELHRFCSLLALGFSLFHVLVLLGDPTLGGNLASLFAPGALSSKAPFAWLGQLSLYALALVVGSFYVRRWIGRKAWRLIHAATLVLYLAALVHSTQATSDSSSQLLAAFYTVTAGALAILALCRSVTALLAKRKRKKVRAVRPA